MDPTQLPYEIFTMIINLATHDGGDRYNPERIDYSTLCNLSLVSSQWHVLLIEQIYSKWDFDCGRQSFPSLWKFLRTILCNRKIAEAVQEIRYETFPLDSYVDGPYAISPPIFSPDDRDMIRNAISNAGLRHIKPDVINAINNADPRPLLALLLANLRNLRTLRACLPHTDMFLAGVLRCAIEYQRNQPQKNDHPLHNLREVYLEGVPWECYECIHPQYIHVNLLWPIFQLPAIQRVSVSDFKPHEGASKAEYSEDFGDIFKASCVTDLNLTFNASSNPCLGMLDSLILLDLPKKLTRLSVSLEGNCEISNTDLWNSIRQYEGSIEYLDVYRDNCEENSHFGSLRAFKHLERLYIQSRVLLGGKETLSDTLPPNLKSLNFYFDHKRRFGETLSQQLQDFISSACLYAPSLWQIVLDKYDWFFSKHSNVVLYDQVENACKKYGVKFETKSLESDRKVGLWHW